MRHPSRSKIVPPVLLLAAAVALGCGDDDGGADDGGADVLPDVEDVPEAPDDAPADDGVVPDDVGPDDSADDSADDGADDGADAGTGLAGRITYQRRPISSAGLGPATPVPAAGVSVRLETAAGEVARTRADDDGRYAFDLPGGAEAWLRVAAGTDDPRPVDTADHDGVVYAVRTDAFPADAPATVDVPIALADNAGAFAIFDTLNRALAAAEAGFGRTTPLPRARAHWERGRSTPYGSSYLSDGEMWFLGGPDDTDEFDVAVVAHELGHFVQTVYPSSTGVPGWPHAGADTDPRLAWQEGWATLFSSLSRDDPWYLDSVSDWIGIATNLGELPLEGEYLGRPAQPMTQTLSEWLVAGAGWALYTAGPDAELQRARSLAVVRDWFGRAPPPDRALEGYDLIDFLDGYLCLHGGADRDLLEAWLVDERRFPYDLAPVCTKSAVRADEPPPVASVPCVGKPGRPCLPFPVALPADGLDRGAVVTGPTGERFRELRVRAAVGR
jgi:hypothetical protein